MNEDFEVGVQQTARDFAYPPTPTIRLRRQRRPLRRWAQMAAVLALLLIGLLAVPDIRAQVIAFFRIGAVQVIVTTATPPADFASGDLPSSVLDFPGATTLDAARQQVGYPIQLPAALPAPDRVYLIDAARPLVVLVWLNDAGAVDVSLHLLPPGTYAFKMVQGDAESTQVNGQAAVWLTAPHWYMLQTRGDAYQMRQVTMPALVWQAADGMTYRLETNRSLADARRIAASIPTGTAK